MIRSLRSSKNVRRILFIDLIENLSENLFEAIRSIKRTGFALSYTFKIIVSDIIFRFCRKFLDTFLNNRKIYEKRIIYLMGCIVHGNFSKIKFVSEFVCPMRIWQQISSKKILTN